MNYANSTVPILDFDASFIDITYQLNQSGCPDLSILFCLSKISLLEAMPANR